MSSRPKLLDLFCCAGAASEGYRRAGFDVYGVDLDRNALKRYPFPGLLADVLNVMRRLLSGESVTFTAPDGTNEELGLDDFAVIVASPPCQAYSITKHSHSNEHPQLVEPTRAALVASGKPYVIENVVGAPLLDPLMLCGSEFDLTATDTDGTPLRMERHRLFESNLFLMGAGGCRHDRTVQVAGAYGGGSVDRAHAKNVRRGGYTPAKDVRAQLLGVDWPVTMHQLSQAIPPAYSEFIGEQLLSLVSVAA